MESLFHVQEEGLLEEFDLNKKVIENDQDHVWYDKYHYSTDIYLMIYRWSLYIKTLGLVEYELKKVCNFHQKGKNENVSMSDFKGNSELDKSKKYLTKICNINFNSLNPEWNYLQNAKNIRNILAHSQGEFVQNSDSNAKKIMSFIHQKDYLEFLPNEIYGDKEDYEYSLDGSIVIKTEEGNQELLSVSFSFFTKLLENNLKYSS